MAISVRRFTCRHCGKPLMRVVSTGATGQRYWLHRDKKPTNHTAEPEGEADATTEATGKKSR